MRRYLPLAGLATGAIAMIAAAAAVDWRAGLFASGAALVAVIIDWRRA